MLFACEELLYIFGFDKFSCTLKIGINELAESFYIFIVDKSVSRKRALSSNNTLYGALLSFCVYIDM
jgi:hypothetical protein